MNLPCRALPLLLSLGLLLGPTCVAGEERSSAQAVAKEVAAAAQAGDEARLQLLAAQDDPDPWRVAEVLEAGGQREVAGRFARAAPRAETTPLCQYLLEAPGIQAQAATRKLLTQAQAAHTQGEAVAAQRLLERLPTPSRTIAAVEGLYLLGEVHAALREPAATSYRAAAEAAEALGWLSMACRAHVATGRALFGRRAYVRAHAAFLQLLRVETLLGSQMGQGRAHYMLSLTSSETGHADDAATYLGRARALAAQSADHEYVAKILKVETVTSGATLRQKYTAFCRAARTLGRLKGEGLATRFRPDPARRLRTHVDLLLACASAARELGEERAFQTHADEARQLAADAGNRLLRLRAEAFKATLEAVVLERRGRDREAAAKLAEVIALYEQLGPHWRPQTVRELHRLASIQVRLGRYRVADDSLQRALALLGQEDQSSERIAVLVLSAEVDLHLGRPSAALRTLDRVDAMGSVQKDRRLKADVLRVRAEHEKRSGAYARARGFLRRARSLCAGQGRAADLGLIDLRLAELSWEMGDPRLALMSLTRAIQELQDSEFTQALRQAQGLRARLLSETGQVEEALADLGTLLEEHQSYGDEVGVARTRHAMADVHFRQARSLAPGGEVRAQHLRSVLTFRELAYKGFASAGAARTAAVVRSQLGRELLMAGQGEEGRAQLHGAYKDCEALGDISGQATCSFALAEAYRVQPDYPEAIKWAHTGLELASDFGLDLAEGEGEEGRARRLMSLVRVGSKAAYRLGSAADLYRFYDRGRAAVLLAALGGREALGTVRVPPALRKGEEEARAAVDRALDAKWALGARPKFEDAQKASRAVRAAQRLVRRARVAIRQEVRMQADLAYPDVPSLEEVAARLNAGDTFLLYGQVFDKIVALLVTRDAQVRMVDIAPAEDVAAAVQAFRADEEYTVDEKLTGRLHKLLLAPLQLGAKVKRLLISPHGSLAYVPFSLLDEQREICFLPSATVFATLRAQAVERGEHILALGDPDYSGTRHADLPQSRVEVNSIAAEARGDTVRLGKDASETVFKQLLREKEAKEERWRAVHLACHGLVDPDNPRESSLELVPGDGNDGSLEGQEVFGLRVPADLVVLSGCETGGGKIIEGEGLEGLTRAFLFAGTPRVIASLWDVDDEATEALMSEFYRLWNPRAQPTAARQASGAASQGKTADAPAPLHAAAALRAAQAHVKNDPKHPRWKHPYYWAAWVIWGLPD